MRKLIKYVTPRGVVKIELDKQNRPIYLLPVGMHGDEWPEIRADIRNKLKKDHPNVCLKKTKHA